MVVKRSERLVSKEIVEFLKVLQCSVYSTEQGYRKDRGGTRMTPGLADLVVFGPVGSQLPLFFIEVKAPRAKKKLRDSQAVFKEECRLRDVPYLCAEDVREVFDWLVEWGVITAKREGE